MKGGPNHRSFLQTRTKICTSVRSLAQITLVFHAKIIQLKSLCPFKSTLYCLLDDQRPLKKQVLLSQKNLLEITSALLLLQIATDFLLQSITKFLQTATGITD